MSGTTPGLEDTKVCPFCAETIRAAAIKCRYCQSDLTDVPPSSAPAEPVTLTKATAPAEPAEPTRPAESTQPTEPSEPTEPSVGRPGAPRILRVLVPVLLVLVLVAGGLAWYHADRRSDLQESRDSAQSAQIVAKDQVETALSYDYRTLEKDQEAAEAVLTDDFRDEYAEVVEEVRGEAEKTRTQVAATVVATAVVDASPEEVELLVFVNQQTRRRDLDAPRIDQNRVVVTLERADDDWRIDDLEAL